MGAQIIGWVLLVAAFCFNAGANVMLKYATRTPVGFNDGIVGFVKGNIVGLTAIGVFAGNVVLYFLALRTLPLSVAYPIMNGMTMIVVLVLAVSFLGERVAPAQIVGCALVVIGATLVAVFGRS
jgi:multidrug transporter EmrE-like cation transporter